MRKLMIVIAGLATAGGATAQTCKDRIEPTAPLERYTLHDDGTATDRRTGLRWQRCPLGYTLDDGGTPLDYADDLCTASGVTTYDWQAALQAAADLNATTGFAGFFDWRVPGIKELMTIVERRCAAPAVNTVVFPDTPVSGLLWSSTTYIRNTEANTLSLADGLPGSGFKSGTGSAHYVRLVR
ncbi:Lcl C-terminal domain-containing protein [Lentisalinibacter orientalis]|uniref:Lcl C-terminal domain-containing protein n=1 Tax=Lentisalinibacter orientalis TaxID=2992241 RepID=UPI003865FB25